MRYGTIPALAIIAALLFAGADAAAKDIDVQRTTSARAPSIEEWSRDQARRANETAAVEAVDEALAELRLDLDIRLASHTSIRIAANRTRAAAR